MECSPLPQREPGSHTYQLHALEQVEEIQISKEITLSHQGSFNILRTFQKIGGYLKKSKVSVCPPLSTVDNRHQKMMVSLLASFSNRKERKRGLWREHIKDRKKGRQKELQSPQPPLLRESLSDHFLTPNPNRNFQNFISCSSSLQKLSQ